MWRMNEQSGVDVENERAVWMRTISEEDIYLLKKNNSYVFLFCIDDNVET